MGVRTRQWAALLCLGLFCLASPRDRRRPPIVPAIPTRSAPRAPWWSIRASIRGSAPCNMPETLPLRDHEVVLTFDDGPLPRNSNQILEILASQCVKATFFTIGRMAQAYPEGVRKLRDAGHTIGTHSQNHPLTMNRMSIERARQEIDDGIASVTAALGDDAALAAVLPHPRPAARRQPSRTIWRRRASRSGAPIFRPTTGGIFRRRASTISRCSRLEAKGKGILLLHDIQARTVAALPRILQRAEGARLSHRPRGAGDPGAAGDADRAAGMAVASDLGRRRDRALAENSRFRFCRGRDASRPRAERCGPG